MAFGVSQTCQVSHIWCDFHAYLFIHAFMQALRTSKWISRIFLKNRECLWNDDTSLNLSNSNLLWAIMSKVATVWQFSLPCIMPKKCLLMKWAPFVGIICCWWRLYLNWQTGPLPKAMLLFFLPFLSLNSYLKDMKEIFLPLICFCFFLIAILSQEFGTLISKISSFSPSASGFISRRNFRQK